MSHHGNDHPRPAAGLLALLVCGGAAAQSQPAPAGPVTRARRVAEQANKARAEDAKATEAAEAGKTPAGKAPEPFIPAAERRARDEIQAVYVRQNAALGKKDFPGFMATFADDYVQKGTGGEQASRAEWAAYVKAQLALPKQQPPVQVKINSIALKGNEAQVNTTHTEKAAIHSSDDTWIKTAQGWKLRVRTSDSSLEGLLTAIARGRARQQALAAEAERRSRPVFLGARLEEGGEGVPRIRLTFRHADVKHTLLFWGCEAVSPPDRPEHLLLAMKKPDKAPRVIGAILKKYVRLRVPGITDFLGAAAVGGDRLVYLTGAAVGSSRFLGGAAPQYVELLWVGEATEILGTLPCTQKWDM